MPDLWNTLYDRGNDGRFKTGDEKQSEPGRSDDKNIEAGESLLRANARQEGGSHYKQFKHETWDVILDWNLGYLDGNAVKYLSRWRLKGGIQDLKKARHYIDKLIEVEEAKKS